MDNLQHLAVSYDAPWPVSAFYPPSELRLLSTATRRLLEIGHSAVLVRMVQCELRSLKVEAERDEEVRSEHFSPAVMRKAYGAFRLVQGSVQAASSFGSNRLRILQSKLRQDIVDRSRSGCAGMFAVIERTTAPWCLVSFSRATRQAPAPTTRPAASWVSCCKSF